MPTAEADRLQEGLAADSDSLREDREGLKPLTPRARRVVEHLTAAHDEASKRYRRVPREHEVAYAAACEHVERALAALDRVRP